MTAREKIVEEMVKAIHKGGSRAPIMKNLATGKLHYTLIPEEVSNLLLDVLLDHKDEIFEIKGFQTNLGAEEYISIKPDFRKEKA